MARQKKKGNPVVFGLVLVGFSICGLWKNELRFDYYKAAKSTEEVHTITALTPNQLFSWSGEMNTKLALKGQYVNSFTGYLEVRRKAEIYAWDRDEDDDGVSWSRKWMSYVQTNDRNKGLKKQLRSKVFRPNIYKIGNLKIEPQNIQFVDPRTTIPPSTIELSNRGKLVGLDTDSDFFYLSKGGSNYSPQLGDERLSYTAIPTPSTATYFGEWSGSKARSNIGDKKEGMISSLIKDTGILHHLVTGNRETALSTINSHIKRLKTTIRIIGLSVISAGGGLLFSGLTHYLIFIPLIGSLITQISKWAGVVIGLTLGALTISIAYLASHPLLLVCLIIAVISLLYMLRKNALLRQQKVRQYLAAEFNHTPHANELKELEFIKRWQLFASDGNITPKEQKELDKWAQRNRLSEDQVATLTEKAQKQLNDIPSPEENIKSLIRYSLADGKIDREELVSIQAAAKFIGLDKYNLNAMISAIDRSS